MEGVPLGLLENREYEEAVFQASRGDLILLYSDGIPDAINASVDDYGLERLIALVDRDPEHPKPRAGRREREASGAPRRRLPHDVDDEIRSFERFTEKPDLETARRMVASGEYSWNSGMFIWRVDRILAELQRQMPDFYTRLQEVEAALGTPEFIPVLAHVWPRVARQTIDYGVMEGAEDVVVFPADLGWADIGSWSSLLEHVQPDADGNILIGTTLGIDTHNSLIYGGGSTSRLIATIGVEGLVIVDTEDALLICPKEREQEVRTLVDRLGKEGLGQWL